MWRYAIVRAKDPAVAEDLIQETLAAALEGLAGFRAEASERTWLLSILRHKLVDHVRRAGRPVKEAKGGDVFEEMFDGRGRWRFDPGRPPPDDVMERPEFWADLERCLAKLPAPLAEAFVMREVRAFSAAAACEALRVTTENLWVRLHRARAHLRRCMERWGGGGKKGRR
jgi:RNA polymerase sigma-70 factor (ECF subfamily)